MHQSLLYIFGKLAYIGTPQKVRQYAAIFRKWDCGVTRIEDIYNGESDFEHRLSLALENDPVAWKAVEDLFQKALTKGKTHRSNGKKVAFIRKGLHRIIARNYERLFSQAEWQREKDTYSFDLFSAGYINYYFLEYDRAMKFVPLPLMPSMHAEARLSMANALRLERNNKGNNICPKLSKTSAKVTVKVFARDSAHVTVTFDWEGLTSERVRHLCDVFSLSTWRTRSEALAAVFSIPHTRANLTDSDSYFGREKTDFYIQLGWDQKYFTWEALLAAEEIIDAYVEPEVIGDHLNAVRKSLAA